jgi:hypothetical protein
MINGGTFAPDVQRRLLVTTVPSCMHGTRKEFDLVVLRDVEGYIGKVEQVLPTGLEKVRHRDHPHYVVKVCWFWATTRDEVALQRFETPPAPPVDRDGVSHEVCQDLRRFGPARRRGPEVRRGPPRGITSTGGDPT